ncbi:tetratricopeptide repeat protein [Mariniblastus sp.]|nr:tetratricopeptide repeat protein [Mariniblastus sp.]
MDPKLINHNSQEQPNGLENALDIPPPHIIKVIRRVIEFNLQKVPKTTELDILELGLEGLSQSGDLNSFRKSLTGVDDSDLKIQIATKDNTYDSLVCADILSFLQTTNKKFDLVFAWDSLLQFNDLRPVIAGIANVLKEGGRTVFGLACPPDETTTSESVNNTRKHYHAVPYVKDCLEAESLSAKIFQRVAPRLENHQPVYYFITHAFKGANENKDSKPQFHDDVAVDHLNLFQEITNNQPDTYQAYFQLGNAQLSTGKFEDAIKSFQKFIEREQNADVFCNIGSAQAQLGDLQSAFLSFQSALELDPNFLPALNNAGRAAHALGDLEAAQNYLKKALSYDPSNPTSHAFMGNIYLKEGDPNQAKFHFEQSIKINPSQPAIQIQLGDLCHQSNQLDKAMQCFVIALQSQPENPEILRRLGAVNLAQGQVSEAGFCSLRAMQIQPKNSVLQSQFINAMLFESSVPVIKIHEETRDWIQKFNSQQKKNSNQFPNRIRDNQKQLKIGILSTAIQSRLINSCVAPVLNSLNEEKFKAILYTDNKDTARVQTLNQQRVSIKPTSHLTTVELQGLIAVDEIDILIDMTGHSDGGRLPCVTSNSAPVQINWLGFPSTTGLPKPNIIFGDEFTIPSQSKKFYSEQIVRVSDCYLCFTPMPLSASEAGTSTNQATGCVFGCFADAKHLSIDVIKAWSQILAGSNDFQLVLKNQVFENESVKLRIKNLFGEQNISPSQISIESKHGNNFCRKDYQTIDIALDPFPYSDPLNALYFLANGTPTITLPGQRFSSNTTSSILNNSGLQEYVASDLEEYVEIAKSSAAKWTSREFTKSRISEQFIESTVCDIANFTKNFETKCRDAWKKWCEP